MPFISHKSLIANIINKLLKNIIPLISGTVIAQIIAVGFQLVLRRMYSPEQFGAFAVYTSLIAILFTVANGRYNRTIRLPKSDVESKNLIALSSIIAILFSIIILIVVLLFKDQIGSLLNLHSDFIYTLLFVPFGLFFYVNYDNFNYWLIRKGAFVVSGSSKVIRRTSDGSSQMLFGYFDFKIGLWLGDIIGQCINFIFVLIFAFKKGFSFNGINLKTIKILAKRYIDFPKYNLFPALLNSISLMAPILIINKFYTEEITGYFDLTRLVLALPLAFVVQSLYQVILQRTSEKRNKNLSIKSEIRKSFIVLLGIVIIMIFIIWILSDFIFGLFGENWESSVVYAKILVFSYAIKLLVSPYSALFVTLEKIKIGSYWQYGNFIIIIVLFLIGGINIFSFLKIFMLLELISYLIYALLILRVLNVYEKSVRYE